MALSRTLPAALPRHLAGARRLRAAVPEASFEVVVAEGFIRRLRGLAGLDPDRLVPLLFLHCPSLHTFGMRAPIDVVWLDLSGDPGSVLGAEPRVAPRRLVRAPRGAPRSGTAALELPPGEAAGLGLEAGVGFALRS